MTVIEALSSCLQRVREIRLPVAEAVATLQLTGIADDIQACINTLAAHAGEKAADGDAEAEEPEETGSAEEDLFGEAEQTEEREAGGEDDKRSDV